MMPKHTLAARQGLKQTEMWNPIIALSNYARHKDHRSKTRQRPQQFLYLPFFILLHPRQAHPCFSYSRNYASDHLFSGFQPGPCQSEDEDVNLEIEHYIR